MSTKHGKHNRLNFESLDRKVLLSSNPWYVDSIKASEIWNNTSSNNKPIVAVVDSGVDLTHPYLKDNLFHNVLDPVDGKDNDGNGYVDDYTGWDFVQNDNSPQDGFYHGTHVAGIVETVSNKGIDILPIRFMDNNGLGYTGAASSAINYATNLKLEGFNIVAINCSFGQSLSYSIPLCDAIKRANDSGIVVVIAAGNDSSNLDITARYPVSLNYSNMISVEATNSDNSLAGYSNYGKTVTVAAPGSSIYSSLPGDNYGYVSGTSMATAVVSGAVGLLNKLGNYSASVIKNALVNGCDLLNNLVDKVKYGFINLQNSMNILKTQAVSTVQPITPSPVIAQIPRVSLSYHLDVINKTNVKGWATVVNGKNSAVVEIYINNVLRYKVSANQYRVDTKSFNGFNILVNKKFLTTKNNLFEIKIKDDSNHLVQTVYKGSFKR